MKKGTTEQLLLEIVALLEERSQQSKKLQALDRRINELAGIVPEDQTRKPHRKTLSPKDFARGCGI